MYETIVDMSSASVLTIHHWIATTPEKVWEAYTTPELFHQFFAPEGLSIPIESVVLEVWPGGRCECVMVFDETGEESPNIGIFTEVEKPHRLVGSEPSLNFSSIQLFDEDGEGTLITIIQEGLPEEIVSNPEVREAFRSSFRKLGRLLGVSTENRD
jgi:uncharacterized protein YndB with AHSA1/START domain